MKNVKTPVTPPNVSYGYLQYLWGTMTVITALFPLLNIFWRIIPIGTWWEEKLKSGQIIFHTEEGSFTYIPVAIITLVTVVVVLFTILLSFSQHDTFKTQAILGSLPAQALGAFVAGVLLFLLYLGLSYAITGGLYWNALGWQDKDFRMVPGDLVLLLSYSAFFGFLTRAFSLLTIKEHLEGNSYEILA